MADIIGTDEGWDEVERRAAMTTNTDDSALVEDLKTLPESGWAMPVEGEPYTLHEIGKPLIDRILTALRTRESDAAKIDAWLREQAREWSDAGEGLMAAAISGLADAIARGDWRDTPADTERGALVKELEGLQTAREYERSLSKQPHPNALEVSMAGENRVNRAIANMLPRILTALKAQENGS